MPYLLILSSLPYSKTACLKVNIYITHRHMRDTSPCWMFLVNTADLEVTDSMSSQTDKSLESKGPKRVKI